MDTIWPYLGNLRAVLSEPWADITLILCSMLCGMIVGFEREAKDKPAGLRTVTLICVGSAIFTIGSLLISTYAFGDPGRIAAQVVTGIGFLGAGAIIRDRGTIIGLTTGATIWTVAAIGVLIGVGYAVAGVVLTLLVVGMLTGVRLFEKRLLRGCMYTHARIIYHPERGKTFFRILRLLDEYRVPDRAWTVIRHNDLETLDLKFCHYHREHRAVVLHINDLPGVVEIQVDRSVLRWNEPDTTNGD